MTETKRTEKKIITRWACLFAEKRYFRLNVEQNLQDVELTKYKKQNAIEAATKKYLNHTQQNERVKNCVKNLKEKQSMHVKDFA